MKINYYQPNKHANQQTTKRGQSFFNRHGEKLVYGGVIFGGCLLVILIFVGLAVIVPTIGVYVLNWIFPEIFTFWKGFFFTLVLSLIFGGTGIKIKTK